MEKLKNKKTQKIITLVLVIAFFAIVAIDLSTPGSSKSSSYEPIIRNELEYLHDIPEIGWFEVDGNNVYIGFKTVPSDLSLIIRGAALRANKAIDFGVHVWAVKASQKGWRPGQGPYYEEVTARHGKIE